MRIYALAMVGLAVGCDSGGDAQELQDRVQVAQTAFTSVAIDAGFLAMETGSQRQVLLLAGIDGTSPTADVSDIAVWSSGDSSVATVSGSGLVTGVGNGQVSLQATFGSLSDSVSLRVSSAPLASIQIEPSSASINECASAGFLATGIYSGEESQPRDITDLVDWSISSAEIGTFDTFGSEALLRTTLAGDATITATMNNVTSAAAKVTVFDNLGQITLPEPDDTLTVSNSVNYSATGSYTDDSPAIDITDNSDWSISSNLANFASVDNTLPDKGLVNAAQVGRGTLSVECGGLTPASLEVNSGSATMVKEVFFGTDSPLNFTFSGTQVVSLNAFARFQNGTQSTVTENSEWSIVSRSNNAYTVSNRSGSKGEVSISGGTGQIIVQFEYTDEDTDGDPTFSQSMTINMN